MMGRPKKYSTPYTGDAVQMEIAFQEYLNCVADCFGESYDDRNYEKYEEKRDTTSLRSVCEEFNISIPKARKLLITAGVYSTEQSRRVSELAAEGKSVAEIMILTGLSRSSVSSYLPYQKFSYHMDECSRHAEDSRKNGEYKGPKAIGQIFGISYVYSMFWKWGLIQVPMRVEIKLKGRRK